MSFAAQTSVPVSRSKAEIESLLKKYGASGFMSGWGDGGHFIGFKCQERMLKFVLPIPSKADKALWVVKKYERGGRYYTHPTFGHGTWKTEAQVDAAIEQEERRRFRALLLVIKAKLEAVASGIATFESEFLSNIVMPDGRTVGQHVSPQIESAYATGRVRALLPEWNP